jgi:hypothetical protein
VGEGCGLSRVGFLAPDAKSHPAKGIKPAETGSKASGVVEEFSLEIRALQKNLLL